MQVYHLLNRRLCPVLSLLVKHQFSSKDPETFLDWSVTTEGHFHAIKRKRKKHLKRGDLFSGVYWVKLISYHFLVWPQRVCVGVKTGHRHRVPSQREEKTGADKAEKTKANNF